MAPGPIPTLVIAGLALAYGLVGLYLVGLVIPPAHRTTYDWVAGTRVVIAASGRLGQQRVAAAGTRRAVRRARRVVPSREVWR
jgi:hypothetical protein